MTNVQYPLEPLFGRLLSPFERFLRSTPAGGMTLIAMTVIALSLASSFGDEATHHFWAQKLTISLGERFGLSLSLHHWINDALMALFFLLVGLELKREILVGELAKPKDAALPALAAVGGMVVPALIYIAFNPGPPTSHGWGIPMATDIAFAIGILVLLGGRIPRNLIIFLTALAIVDDLGAVLVIAVFYSANLNLVALGAAGGLFAVLCVFSAGGIRNPIPYALVGIVLWYAVLVSGVHATIAGILLAMAIPARPAFTPAQFDRRVGELHGAFREERGTEEPSDGPISSDRMCAIAQSLEGTANAVQSPLQRIEHQLSPWVTFLVLPLFALANAGIDLTAVDWGSALSERVTLGVMAGLVLGKVIGITLFSWIAIRLGLARLPTGVTWLHLIGAAWLGGIGFTMSLFIGQLAFTDAEHIELAKLGILLGSLASALIGLTWLTWVARKPGP